MSAHDDDKAAETAQFLEVKEGDHSNDLPSPVSAQTPKSKPKLSTAVIIPVWIAISSSVIIYNNYLYNTLNFKYPVFLVTFHLGFAVRYASGLNTYVFVLKEAGDRRWERVSCNARRTCWTASRTCL